MNNTNDIVIVNYDDEQIDKTSKQEAHEKGLLHRAFSIYIVNEKNEILLQKRNINKYHSGGLWTNTCCSHPASDCNLLEFASERLQEEFGINVSEDAYTATPILVVFIWKLKIKTERRTM